jgi:hypothetical protein
MKIPGDRRTRILVGALLLTFGAVALVSGMDESQTVATAVAKRHAPDGAGAPSESGGVLGAARVQVLRQQLSDKASADLFAARSFYVAPPPKPLAVVTPPPPKAPPLPFAYMGRFQEGGASVVIFLTRGERLYSVRVGEVIDETYRIENLTPNEVIFIYLPMDERQVLRIAEAS